MAESTPLLQASMPATSFRRFLYNPYFFACADRTRSTATFADALQTEKGRLPQAIAHRGFKVEFPENSMKAFEGAVAIGAHALETDIHITRDNVVVLSHVCSCSNRRAGCSEGKGN